MIVLHNISGISIKSGSTHDDAQFIQFFVDYLADQQDGECTQCGAVIDMGWMCLDDGDEYCFDHVRECSGTYRNCFQCERLSEAEIRCPA